MNIQDEQIGPAQLKELRSKFKQGEVTPDCYFWYEGMGGWESLESNASLMKQINPPPPPRRKSAGGQLPPPPMPNIPPPPAAPPPKFGEYAQQSFERPSSHVFAPQAEPEAVKPRRKVSVCEQIPSLCRIVADLASSAGSSISNSFFALLITQGAREGMDGEADG